MPHDPVRVAEARSWLARAAADLGAGRRKPPANQASEPTASQRE